MVSNHPDMAGEAARFGIHFEHIPVERDAKPAAERALLDLLGGEYDLIVLARYMQILSPQFLAAAGTPIINIHHSFLPAFAGANPYARAYERGVKLIGATAHYVTEELDAGPIIEQDVARVTHRENVDDAGADRGRHRADRAPARRPLAPRGPRPGRRQSYDRLLMTERMPVFVGCVTLVAGSVLLAAPGRLTAVLGIEGQELAVRAIGLSDLVLVPGLLRGRPRWPWMAGRAALNLAQAAYLHGVAPQSAPDVARAGAAALAGLTVVDGATALVLRGRSSTAAG